MICRQVMMVLTIFLSKNDMDEIDFLSELEHWADRAAQELQEFIDEAEAAGNGPECLTGTRDLLVELDELKVKFY